jgi:hypothetical protein
MEGFLLPLGAVFVLSWILLLILKTERRDIILERFRLRRRRDSGSRTPPRSLSPEKKRTQSTSNPDYSTTVPPSRRSALVEAKLSSPVEAVTASPSDWAKRILPITASYLEASDDTYTPCEFSVKQIKALGDFPDYAALSGVPLPQPYPDFDIKKAIPRPYRPFRWAYHQTMCKKRDLLYSVIADLFQH